MNKKHQYSYRKVRLHKDIEACKRFGKKLRIGREIIEQINRTRDLKTR